MMMKRAPEDPPPALAPHPEERPLAASRRIAACAVAHPSRRRASARLLRMRQWLGRRKREPLRMLPVKHARLRHGASVGRFETHHVKTRSRLLVRFFIGL